jgi:outer membrane immunogenic protein
MKKLLVAGIAAAAFCGAPALAADMPVKSPYAPAFSWTGCYVGANAGFGWAKTTGDGVPAVGAVAQGSHTADGAVGGGQTGCDYQTGAWVFGVQGMFDGANLKGSNVDPFAPAFTFASKHPWFGTLSARIGYTIQPMTLLYGKIGGGWLRSESTFNAAGATDMGKTTRSGLMFGGGIEHMFAPNLSAFVEYDNMNFGTKGVIMTDNIGVSLARPTKQDAQVILIGINYRFGDPGFGKGPISAKY